MGRADVWERKSAAESRGMMERRILMFLSGDGGL